MGGCTSAALLSYTTKLKSGELRGPGEYRTPPYLTPPKLDILPWALCGTTPSSMQQSLQVSERGGGGEWAAVVGENEFSLVHSLTLTTTRDPQPLQMALLAADGDGCCRIG